MTFIESDLAYGVVAVIGVVGAVWLLVTTIRRSWIWAVIYGGLLLCGGLIYTGRAGSMIYLATVAFLIANVIMVVRHPAAAAFPLCLMLLGNIGFVKLGGVGEYKKRFPTVFRHVPAPAKITDPTDVMDATLKDKSPLRVPHGKGL